MDNEPITVNLLPFVGIKLLRIYKKYIYIYLELSFNVVSIYIYIYWRHTDHDMIVGSLNETLLKRKTILTTDLTFKLD